MSREEPINLVQGQPVDVLPSGQYASGTRVSDVFRCPVDADICRTVMDRESWPDRGTEEIVSVIVDVSTDAGASWGLLYRFKARGGQIMRAGVEETQSRCVFPLPEVSNPNRLVRVTTSNAVQLNTRVQLIVEKR